MKNRTLNIKIRWEPLPTSIKRSPSSKFPISSSEFSYRSNLVVRIVKWATITSKNFDTAGPLQVHCHIHGKKIIQMFIFHGKRFISNVKNNYRMTRKKKTLQNHIWREKKNTDLINEKKREKNKRAKRWREFERDEKEHYLLIILLYPMTSIYIKKMPETKFTEIKIIFVRLKSERKLWLLFI